MAVWTDIVGSLTSRAAGVLRGWFFRLRFNEPPTPEELTQEIENFVELMVPSSPRLQEWLAEHGPELSYQILGIYRDQ